MKQRYTIGNYVKISQLDDEGNSATLLAEIASDCTRFYRIEKGK